MGEPIENFSRIIDLVVDLESFRIVGKPGRIFDVVNFVSEALQADDVMDVLPNYACNRHPAHESHDDDALAGHYEENAERRTPNIQSRTKKERL